MHASAANSLDTALVDTWLKLASTANTAKVAITGDGWKESESVSVSAESVFAEFESVASVSAEFESVALGGGDEEEEAVGEEWTHVGQLDEIGR